ncbi:MAG: electron transport complex subunit RsxE [Bdellovibrionota bacterium]|jgi:electron transport complex protein RnfE
MSQSSKGVFIRGLWNENPVLRQMLGICPTLAVTTSVINGICMGLSTTFVLVCSNILVSLLKSFIPKEVRIACYILIIATFVTIVDYILQATTLEVHQALGPFIALITVNCIILGRAEAFASKNSVWLSILDGLGMGLGFTFSLFLMSSIREVLGAGSFAGIKLFGESFQPIGIFILPAGGFIVLGCLLICVAWITKNLKSKEA